MVDLFLSAVFVKSLFFYAHSAKNTYKISLSALQRDPKFEQSIWSKNVDFSHFLCYCIITRKYPKSIVRKNIIDIFNSPMLWILVDRPF